MQSHTTITSLPTKNLRAAFEFYKNGLGLPLHRKTTGDEMPEPVEFVLGGAAHLMLVPTGGFKWVIGDHRVAEAGASECVVGICVSAPAEVDNLIEKAKGAGAEVFAPPAEKPWGYSGAFRDLDGHVFMVSVRAPDAD